MLTHGLLLLGVGCSLSIDVDRVQCATDDDCTKRGGEFVGSTCEKFLCRPARQSTCRGDAGCATETASTTDACVGARCQPAPIDPPDAQQEAPAATPPDAAMVVQTSPQPQPPPSPRGECTIDKDCTPSGGQLALCVDALCWTPQAPIDCTRDDECAARGPEFVGGKCFEATCRPNPRWRCERPTPAALTDSVELNILVRSSLSLAPLPDIHAFICEKLDLTCAQPIGEVTTNAEGMLIARVPANFAGYLQFDDREYMPALYFLPPVLPRDGKLQPAPLLGVGVVDALAVSIGSRIDPARGHMMLISEDCYGMALAGVSFSTPAKDAKTIQFYVRDLLPAPSETTTGEVGNGGYLNLPPGNTIIKVTMVETKLALTEANIVVRPGFITVAYLRPELR